MVQRRSADAARQTSIQTLGTTLNPGEYYTRHPSEALLQGDIVFAPIVRLDANPPSSEIRWARLDQRVGLISSDEPEQPPMRAASGYTAVMITSHDCSMDKELLREYHALRAKGVSKADAVRRAEDNEQLDRYVSVSPILPMSWLRTDAEQVARGEAIGLFPVPALPACGILAGAVDLAMTATVDRTLVVAVLASLSEQTRVALRFALARFYASPR